MKIISRGKVQKEKGTKGFFAYTLARLGSRADNYCTITSLAIATVHSMEPA